MSQTALKMVQGSPRLLDKRRGKTRATRRCLGRAASMACEALEGRMLLSTDTWLPSGGGSWETPGNWSLNHAPTSGDDAVISNAGTYTITVASAASVNSLTLGGASGTQTLQFNAPNSLTVAADSTIDVHGVVQGMKTLSTGGTLRVKGQLTLAGPGATVGGAGTLTTLAGGQATLIGTSVSSLLVNQGTIQVQKATSFTRGITASAGSLLQIMGISGAGAALTVSGGLMNDGTISLTNNATNLADATLTVNGGPLTNAGDGTINFLDGAGTNGRTINAVLNNQGTINIGRTGTINTTSAADSNSGIINLTGGNLWVGLSGTAPSFANTGSIFIGASETFTVHNGTSSNSATGVISGPGTFALDWDNATMSANPAVGALSLSNSTMNLPASMSTVLTMNFSTLNGPGTLTNAAGQTVTWFGSRLNCPLINQGTIIAPGLTTFASLTTAAGSTLQVLGENHAGAALTVSGGLVNHGTIQLIDDGTSTATAALMVNGGAIINAVDGTIVSMGGANAHTINDSLVNQGVVSVSYPLTINTAGTTSNNSGTINVTGGDLTVALSGNPASFGNTGVINIGAGRMLTQLAGGAANPLLSNNPGIIASDPASTLSIAGSLQGTTTNANLYAPQGNVLFNGSGTASAPQFLEAMSKDLGNASGGFARNFAYGTISLSNNTYLKLVDLVHNIPGSTGEALYVNSLIVPAGCTFDLNGLKVYARSTQIGGTILNGTITPVSSGGAIMPGKATPAQLSSSGQVDDWSLWVAAGHTLGAVLNTGGTGATAPAAPQLGWGEVQVLDGVGNVIASADNTTGGSGTPVSIVTAPVTTSGTYHLHIEAPASHSSATGNYVLTSWIGQTTRKPIGLNNSYNGAINTPIDQNQWTFSAAAGQSVQFHLQNESTPAIAFTLTGPSGYTGFTNVTADSASLTLPSAGTYTLTAQSTTGQTGSYSFIMFDTTVVTLNPGTPFNGTLVSSGQGKVFKINVPTPEALRVQLQDPTAADHTELYLKYGAAPTRSSYDYGVATAGASHSLLASSAAPGQWYVLVYGESVAGNSAFTLTATAATVKVTGVSPATGSTSAANTLTIKGAGFNAGSSVSLVSSTNVVYPATSSSTDLPTQITATFAAASLPAGTYAVKVTQSNGVSDQLAGAYTVAQTGQSSLKTNVEIPKTLGYHIAATIYVDYTNTGTAPMPAPLLELSATLKGQQGALLTLDASRRVSGFWTSATPVGYAQSVGILASGATPGVLQPGESGRVPVYYGGWLRSQWDMSYPPMNFTLSMAQAGDSTPVNWTAAQADLQPTGFTTASWGAVYPTLAAQLGNTSGGYVQLLDSDAQALGRLGENVTDVSRLWGYSLLQANGLSPLGALASGADASVPGPGVALDFIRTYNQPISARYTTGTLGYGWSAPWQQHVVPETDGSVQVYTGNDGMLYYQPDSRHAGTFFAPSSTSPTLTLSGGIFTLTESQGNLTVFRSDGKLDYMQDPNGNKVTAGYNSNGRLTTLTHSSGQSLTIAYNSANLIASVTDSFGRQTTYSYDASNQHLLSVTTPQGTTQYTYSIGNGAAREHALTSIAFADGTHTYLNYDSLGRLTSTAGNSNAMPKTYTYDQPGEVTTTDGTGAATQTFFNELAQVVKLRDALGNITALSYDPVTHQVATFTDPLGQVSKNTYDSAGNLVKTIDPLGRPNTYTYGALSRLTSFTDAGGDSTTFTYDANGNLLSTTYPNNSVSQTTFDPLGQATSFITANGQAITFQRNASGQVTQEGFPDGSNYTYTYDAHGNLHTATDASGTTTFTYNAADRLTRVDYPGGKFLQFTLDAAGRRTRMVDQTGFTLNYVYDAAGRLWKLNDASGTAVISYTYDAAGQLSRKDNANGTYTTYQRDADGNVLHLVNYAPAGAVNSRFDYTYDALGRCTTMEILDGTWTYTYDAMGELTHAVFASTNGTIASQDLTYTYDARGNRTSTLINGVSTTYTSNGLNQYVTVGGVACTYDADGNLTSDGTNTYTYDFLDRLTSVKGPSGTTTYTYDALNHRTASTTNGQTTQYLVSPDSIPSPLAEFDGSGNTIAHNIFGLGLVGRAVGSAAPASANFYSFDALGSVAGLSNAAGSYVDHYDYLPFGGTLSSSVTVPNPSGYMGQQGVTTGPAALIMTGARTLDSVTGRFQSVDPLWLAGGGTNAYVYASNNGITTEDPTGLGEWRFYNDEEVDGGPDEFWGQTDGYSDGFSATFGVGAGNGKYVSLGPGVGLGVNLGLASGGYGPHAGWGLNVSEGKEVGSSVGYSRGYTKGRITGWGYDTSWDKKLVLWTEPDGTEVVYMRPQDFNNAAKHVNLIKFTDLGIRQPVVKDPNDKLTLDGFGAANFVQAGTALPYRIDFENSSTATAPVQFCSIADQLSPNDDWSTFQLTEIGWGDTLLTIPDGTQHYQTTVSMTYNGQTFDVDVEAGIDQTTGQVFATFQCVDPATSLPPDALTGFLPPEDGTGQGQGHITYTVQPVADLPTGTQITNVASIVFDTNQPLATDLLNENDPSQGTDPAKDCLVTIDSVAPTSSVSALPAHSSTSVPVSWSGQDDPGGSGVGSYDVYVSADGGDFTPWLTGTTDTGGTYTGVAGHTYGFYSVAHDNVGNTQSTPAAPQAQIVVDPDGLVAGAGAVYGLTGALGSQTLNVTAGGVTLNSDLGSSIPGLGLSIGSGASASANAPQTLAALNIAQNPSGAYLGNLDLGGNSMTIPGDAGSWTGSSYSGITGMVASGFHAGAWDGNGIRSSAAASDPAGNHGLAVRTSGASAVVQYAWNGDTNGDNTVDYLDYGAIDNAYLWNQAHPSSPHLGYGNGDLNLDGVVNYLDYGMMDNAYLAINATHAAGATAASAPAVVTPAGTAFSTAALATKPDSDPSSVLTDPRAVLA